MAFETEVATEFAKDAKIVVAALVQSLKSHAKLARGNIKNRKYHWYYRNFAETPTHRVFDPVRPYMIVGEVEHNLQRAGSTITWKLVATASKKVRHYEPLRADVFGN